MKTILTLIYGSKYNADDVHRIYNATNGKYNYVCLADEENAKHLRQEITVIPLDPELEGHWHKINMFNVDIPGKVLYLDLDVIIQNSLEKFFDFSFHPTICYCYWKSTEEHITYDNAYPISFKWLGMYNSSVMTWQDNNAKYIYDMFMQNPEYYMTKYWGDDRFLFHEDTKMNIFPKKMMYSFIAGVDHNTDVSPRAFQIKPEYPIVLLNGQEETTENLRQKYYDALSMHKMG